MTSVTAQFHAWMVVVMVGKQLTQLPVCIE